MEMNPIRPFGKAYTRRIGTYETTQGKCTGNRKRKKKSSIIPVPPPQQDEDSERRNLLPPYMLPKRSGELKVKIPMQTGAMPITPLVPK